jgi:uncharacterized protein YciI
LGGLDSDEFRKGSTLPTGFASYGDSFIFRGPIRSADGADNIGTAMLLELPDRAAADAFWSNEPFARNGRYQRDSRITRWMFGD